MSLADQIINTGPAPAGETYTIHCTPAEINELRDELIAGRHGTTHEEWRVTGTYGPEDQTFTFTWSGRGYEDPEAHARNFIKLSQQSGAWGWIDGPHLHKRTVTVTDWQEAEA